MSRYRVVMATTPDEVAEAQQVRERVYREEEGLWQARPQGSRDPRDSAAETALFVAYGGAEAVGTIRVSRLATRAAPPHAGATTAPSSSTPEHAWGAGFAADAVVGLVERYCVLRRFRGTAVAPALYESLRVESRRRGFTHWVAAANTETDCPQEAALIYRVAAVQGLVREGREGADAREPPVPPAPWPTGPRSDCVRHVYTPAQRRQATAKGTVTALPLPRTLVLFAKRMSARYIGPPFFDPSFGVFALPLVAPV